jgi:hypothetical protein
MADVRVCRHCSTEGEYAFCSNCYTPTPVDVVSAALLWAPLNALILVGAFVVCGFVDPFWGAVAYVFVIYLQLVAVALHLWPRVRILMLIAAMVTMILLSSSLSPFNRISVWFALTLIVAVLALLRGPASTAFRGLAGLVLVGASGAWAFSDDIALVTGIGQELLRPLLAVSLARALYVFAIVGAVSSGMRLRRLATLSVPPLLRDPASFRPWATKGLSIRRLGPGPVAFVLSVIVAVIVTAIKMAVVAWNQIVFAWHLSLRVAVVIVNFVWRVIVYTVHAVGEILIGVCQWSWDAFLMANRAIALSATIVIFPLALSTIVAEAIRRFGDTIQLALHGSEGVGSAIAALVLATSAMLLAAIFGTWSFRVSGVWLASDARFFDAVWFTHPALDDIRKIGGAIQNYALGAWPRLMVLYSITLLAFDFLGYLGYGPYRFGPAALICVVFGIGAVFVVGVSRVLMRTKVR